MVSVGVVAGLLIGMAHYEKPTMAGDGPEYASMLESLADHGSPEQRTSDADRLGVIFRRHDIVVPHAHDGFLVDSRGRWYSYHFWAYPLAAVPAKLLLRAFGKDEFLAFFATNLILLGTAVVAALRASALSFGRRGLFAALAALSPVLWYVPWPHAEVFIWSFVVMGLAFLHRRGWAALCFAVASLQAPPIAVIAWVPLALALRERRPADAARAFLGALPTLLPSVFFFLHFGHPNPIAASGLASPRFITFGRFWSFFFDLDQGLALHAPATFVLGLVGVIALARRRRQVEGLVLTAALLVMAVLATSGVNWNGGCCGVLRYCVWVLPVLAWLAAKWAPARPWTYVAGALVVGAQLSHLGPRITEDDSLEHNATAHWVLSNAPGLWNPEPEIFAERTLGSPTDAPWVPLPLPIGYVHEGSVTKLLTDAAGLDRLEASFDVAPGYAADVRTRYSQRSGLFYVEPPRGMLRPRARAPLDDRKNFDPAITLGEGWYGLHHDDGIAWSCAGAHASLRLEPSARDRVLSLRLHAPLDIIGHPVRIRIRAGDHALDDLDVFSQVMREWTFPEGADDVTIEVSETVPWPGVGEAVGVCLDGAHLR